MMPAFIVIHGMEPEAFAFSDDGTEDEARDLANHVYRFLREEQEQDPEGVVTVVNGDIHEQLEVAFNGDSGDA